MALRLNVRAVSKNAAVGVFSFEGHMYSLKVPCTIDTGADS